MKTRQAPHCAAICTLSVSIVYKLRLQVPEDSWLALGCWVCCKISVFMKSKYKCSKCNCLLWLMGFKRWWEMQVTVPPIPPPPHEDSSALHGPITQVWSGIMTYHQACRESGCMKKRKGDKEGERGWRGWWGVNDLCLTAMSLHHHTSRLLSPSYMPFHSVRALCLLHHVFSLCRNT